MDMSDDFVISEEEITAQLEMYKNVKMVKACIINGYGTKIIERVWLCIPFLALRKKHVELELSRTSEEYNDRTMQFQIESSTSDYTKYSEKNQSDIRYLKWLISNGDEAAKQQLEEEIKLEKRRKKRQQESSVTNKKAYASRVSLPKPKVRAPPVKSGISTTAVLPTTAKGNLISKLPEKVTFNLGDMDLYATSDDEDEVLIGLLFIIG